MKFLLIFCILTLFYIVNSFAIQYSECHQRFLKTKEQVCNGNGKCHIFFGCQCFDGFIGEKCEEKIERQNGCYLNKCFEGSECIEISPKQYYCECPENRFGSFCEFEDLCFDCIGKCYEIEEDIFECDELGKIDRNVSF
uniref:EGF-like domain-containing protein n=1 Tax=Panagrolaimus davidi TaxID=227884 RepID=A0A914QTG7_9BILA